MTGPHLHAETPARPTQVAHPWRATLRTVVAALVGLAAILPLVVQASGLDPAALPWLAGVLGVTAAVTRILAVPQVEEFLRRHGLLSWLATAPPPPVEVADRPLRAPYDRGDLPRQRDRRAQ